MKHITTDELKQINREGIVLQGCGGNPGEWLAGINELLTKEGILRDGSMFKDAYVFEHGGLTNMLFDMENVKLDIGKLAMWRLQTHGNFGGTWLSDYLPNKLGVEMAERGSGRNNAIIGNDMPDVTGNASDHHPLRVYVENANNGFLGGFTMPLPATAEELRPFLEGIEIGSVNDIKIFEVLSDSDCLNEAMAELLNKPMPAEALDEINYLAAKIDAMNPSEYETYGAALEAKRHCGSIAELINLTENLDRFELQPAFDAAMLGEHLLDGDADICGEGFQKLYETDDEELRRVLNYIETLEKYVDYSAYGKEYAENEQGVFTDQGYLTKSEGFKKIYRGPQDIPADYRVIPPVAQALENRRTTEKPSVLDQIAAARVERAAAPMRDAPDKPKYRGPEL